MSSQWRALPASLDPETAYLVDALRDLKDRSGLSLAALGTATPYSKSSWERYLNGRILPPRHAVESLAEVTGQPAGRLLALWQLAEVRCSGRDQTQAPAVDGPVAPAIVDPAPAGRDVRVPAWLGIAAAVAIGILVVVLTKPFGFLRDSAPAAPGYSVGCHGAQCAGREPEGMACALDAVTSGELRIARTDVELRISRRCGAAWTRISHSALGDEVQVSDQDGRTESTTVASSAATGQFISTRMVPVVGSRRVRACLQRGGARLRCTAPIGGG
jgi:transcriptional regulator with XRE-family HTH domain